MENDENLISLLKRIADALEKIALCLDKRSLQNRSLKILANIRQPSDKLRRDGNSEKFADIADFLSSRGIELKSVGEEDDLDEFIDGIALFMGDRYSLIKPVYKKMKKVLNNNKTLRIDMKNYNKDVIGSVTWLCSSLYNIAFLETFVYNRSTKMLIIRLNKIPDAVNFITGGWLERYAKKKVIELIKSLSGHRPPDYTYLKNLRVILPNGNDFELDLIFRIRNEFFWIEAKTGEYQKHIEKYSKITNILKMDRDHAFLLLAEVNEEALKALPSLFKMKVTKIENFGDEFGKSILHLMSEKNCVKESEDENANRGIIDNRNENPIKPQENGENGAVMDENG